MKRVLVVGPASLAARVTRLLHSDEVEACADPLDALQRISAGGHFDAILCWDGEAMDRARRLRELLIADHPTQAARIAAIREPDAPSEGGPMVVREPLDARRLQATVDRLALMQSSQLLEAIRKRQE